MAVHLPADVVDAPTKAVGWSFVQWSLLVLLVANLAWSIAGFVAEPSFAIGHDAPTASVLGVDFNGWHALSGVLLIVPGLFATVRKQWALWYCVIAAGLILAPGIWAMFAHQVAIVLHFPNNGATALLHVVLAVCFLSLVAIQALLDGGLKQAFRR